LKKSHHMILTLTLVGVLSSSALVGVYRYTQPMIQLNQQKALKEAIFRVLPEADSFEEIVKNGKSIYKGLDSSGKVVGYAFVGEGPGYQGIIKLMIGVDPELRKTFAIEILESVETPGLGQKITTPFFKEQFHHLEITSPIRLVKKKPATSNEIQAITGATISSQAVVDIVNSTVAKVKELLESQIPE